MAGLAAIRQGFALHTTASPHRHRARAPGGTRRPLVLGAALLFLLFAGCGQLAPLARDLGLGVVKVEAQGRLYSRFADGVGESILAAGPKPRLRPPVPDTPVGAVAPPAQAHPADHPALVAPTRLTAFYGLSTWVDTYDVDLSPQAQVAIAAERGVQTIFAQSARYSSPTDVHDYVRLSTLIEAAHDAGIAVMVWYIPDFVDLDRDFRRAQAAMALVTPRGDRPDAFGLDIEVADLPDVAERSRRLLVLSTALRDWVGPDYPMAAIVLPPLQLELNTKWWPGFPYAQLRPLYDVYVPMSYSSYRGQDFGITYDWNARNVGEIRRLAGDEALPVHLAGGIADALPEVGAFVAAAQDSAVLGAGLYDLHTTRPDAWDTLRALRADG